jgi:hypothetical protein
MKTHGGVYTYIDLRILDLGTGLRLVVSFTSRPLYPVKIAHYTNEIGDYAGPSTGLNGVEKENIYHKRDLKCELSVDALSRLESDI